MNKKDQRRKRAADRLKAQLEAGVKPYRSTAYQAGSSRKWKTLLPTEPLSATDRARIERELASLH